MPPCLNSPWQVKNDHRLPATALIKRQNRLFLALAMWLALANGISLSFVMSYVSWALLSTSPLGLALMGLCPETTILQESQSGLQKPTHGEPRWRCSSWQPTGPAGHLSKAKLTLPHTHHGHLVECSCVNTKQNHQRSYRPPTKLWKFYHIFIVSYYLLDCFAIQDCWRNSWDNKILV